MMYIGVPHPQCQHIRQAARDCLLRTLHPAQAHACRLYVQLAAVGHVWGHTLILYFVIDEFILQIVLPTSGPTL